MKSKHFHYAFLFAAGLLCANGFAQNSRWYFGSGLGAQQWRGPLNANVGMGGELVVGHQLTRHGGLAFVAGFASLPFQQSTLNNGVKFLLASREANLFHGDFLVDLHPLGTSAVSPFVRFGGGVLNAQVGSARRKNYVSGVLGAGARLQLTRDLALNLTGSYHHLAGQTLEGFSAGNNPDGYVSARLGLTFSARSGEEKAEEPWFTISDTEFSPPENSSPDNTRPSTNAPPIETAAHDSSAPILAAEVEGEEEGFWVEEITAAQPEDHVQVEEQIPSNVEPAPIQAENTPAPAQVKEQIPTSVEPAPIQAEIAPPRDATGKSEEPVEAGDPYARFNRKLDLLDNASEEEAPQPGTETASVLGDEPKFEEFYPAAKPEAQQHFKDKLFATAPPAEEEEKESEEEAVYSSSAFEARLARLEEQEDFLSPTTEIADAPSANQAEAEVALPRPAPASTESASQNEDIAAHAYSAPKIESHKSPEPARAEHSSPRPKARPREELPKRVQPAPKPAARTTQEEEELKELRAILDKLDAGGASHRKHELKTSEALALNADPEIAELHLRLDEIEDELSAYAKSSQAYEAFKDRLGLQEGAAKKAEPAEWNQQQLKSQIDNIDQELAQKEEDITAIRTALAQSAANGAAFPTSALVTRGSFAQGYESALNSFYQQSYEEAIEKFSRLVERFPHHTLASNCHYWLGEAQYGFGDYVTALASFNHVLTFQRSLKKDNALLMLGKTYLALQRPTDARAMFNRLLSEYPASDAVAKAQELMKEM